MLFVRDVSPQNYSKSYLAENLTHFEFRRGLKLWETTRIFLLLTLWRRWAAYGRLLTRRNSTISKRNQEETWKDTLGSINPSSPKSTIFELRVVLTKWPLKLTWWTPQMSTLMRKEWKFQIREKEGALTDLIIFQVGLWIKAEWGWTPWEGRKKWRSRLTFFRPSVILQRGENLKIWISLIILRTRWWFKGRHSKLENNIHVTITLVACNISITRHLTQRHQLIMTICRARTCSIGEIFSHSQISRVTRTSAKNTVIYWKSSTLIGRQRKSWSKSAISGKRWNLHKWCCIWTFRALVTVDLKISNLLRSWKVLFLGRRSISSACNIWVIMVSWQEESKLKSETVVRTIIQIIKGVESRQRVIKRTFQQQILVEIWIRKRSSFRDSRWIRLDKLFVSHLKISTLYRLVARWIKIKWPQAWATEMLCYLQEPSEV